MSMEEKYPMRSTDVSALALMTQAVRNGHVIDEKAMPQIIEDCLKIIDDPTAKPRYKGIARRMLLAIRSEAIETARKVHEWERLDAGKTTENVTHKLYAKDAPTEDV